MDEKNESVINRENATFSASGENAIDNPEHMSDQFSRYLKDIRRFSAINKLITRDLNNNRHTPSFSLYSKDNINEYLKNPYQNQKQLREAVTYIYGASSHFRRLIQYFVGLSDLAYIVSPTRLDPKQVKPTTISKNYRKVLDVMNVMNVKTQLPKILTVCLREDTTYCTMLVSADNITIQHLPPDYCQISAIENGVANVTFNFSYFDTHSTYLEYFPQEFRRKYELYRGDQVRMRWQELDSPTSFAIKCNSDILEYSIPPFAGILREIYDLEDYKQLQKTKTEIENYALLVMKLGSDDSGNWTMDYTKATDFWRNLDSVLPDEIGSVLSPMDITKIGFERPKEGQTNPIHSVEQNLFSAAGVSSLLFNNDKASANALTLSIKADQAITYGIVKNIENAINRYIQAQKYGKYFKVTFLDCSPYNRKELGEAYLKACQYGLPFLSMYAASQGLSQSEMDCMSFLENDVLGLPDMLRPLVKQTGQDDSKDDLDKKGATDEGGAPEKDIGELSDSGEQSREDGDDW